MRATNGHTGRIWPVVRRYPTSALHKWFPDGESVHNQPFDSLKNAFLKIDSWYLHYELIKASFYVIISLLQNTSIKWNFITHFASHVFIRCFKRPDDFKNFEGKAGIVFVKIHAPWELLCKWAEISRMRKPIAVNDVFQKKGKSGRFAKVTAIQLCSKNDSFQIFIIYTLRILI